MTCSPLGPGFFIFFEYCERNTGGRQSDDDSAERQKLFEAERKLAMQEDNDILEITMILAKLNDYIF